MQVVNWIKNIFWYEFLYRYRFRSLRDYFEVFVGIYLRVSWSKNKDACKLATSNYNFTIIQIVKSKLGDLEQHKWVKTYLLI